MLLRLLLLTALSVVKSLAEAPLNNYYSQAPYAPAGFRPSIPFDLPGEYYPSYELEAEQQLPNQGITFEITKQRVDFAGQEIQRVPISEPQNQYLPPEQIVFVNNRVGNNNRKNFGHRHNHRRRHGNGNGNGNGNDNGNGQTPSETPQNNTPQTKPPQFQPNLPPLNIPLPKPNTDERFESQQFFPKEQQRPALEYGTPNYNIDPRNKGHRPGSQYESADGNLGFVQPALEYGAPNNIFEDQQKPAIEYGAPARSQDNEDDELAKQFALDALNAAVENYNRLQEKDIDKIAQGQYFVVNPDHSIQKVKFTTKKSEDETRQTDFTAELKYTKVGEINDPLYKYTAEGQLVRIVKK